MPPPASPPDLDLDAYFARIGFSGEAGANLATLRRLHLLHPLAIPFENLSPLLGLEVPLDAVSLQEKLVIGRRGGYCFEQNLLFAGVLRALGFRLKGLSARVLWEQPEGMSLPRTHMLLQVEIGGETFLADVGFGAMTQTGPLRLESGEQETPHESYRLERAGEDFSLLARVGGRWKPLYSFDLRVQNQADYEVANWYVSRHPRSRFIRQLVAGRPGDRCRHALIDNRYSRYRLDGGMERRELDPAGLRQVLEEVFAIDLDGLPELEARLQGLCAGEA